MPAAHPRHPRARQGLAEVNDTKLPRKPKRNCTCGDAENCRVCAVKKAHACRIAGDEKEYEVWYAKALGILEAEKYPDKK